MALGLDTIYSRHVLGVQTETETSLHAPPAWSSIPTSYIQVDHSPLRSPKFKNMFIRVVLTLYMYCGWPDMNPNVQTREVVFISEVISEVRSFVVS